MPLSLRIKDLPGPATREKEKKKTRGGETLLSVAFFDENARTGLWYDRASSRNSNTYVYTYMIHIHIRGECQDGGVVPGELQQSVSVKVRTHPESTIQGQLDHRKPPSPLGPQQEPKHGPTVGSWDGAASDELGNPVQGGETHLSASIFEEKARTGEKYATRCNRGAPRS